jgi:hypothetical protein
MVGSIKSIDLPNTIAARIALIENPEKQEIY